MLDLSVFAPKLSVLSAVFASQTLDDPEDVYQEMCLALLEKSTKSPQFENQNESYIIHAARLRALTLTRDRKTFDTYQIVVSDDPDSEDAWYDEIASESVNPEDALIRKQELAGIAEALRSLSDREAEVMGMVVNGIATGQIASKLGCSPAAVCVYKNRAIGKIRAHVC